LTARKLAVGVGATWPFAGTPPSLAASTPVRDSGEALNDHKSLDAEEKRHTPNGSNFRPPPDTKAFDSHHFLPAYSSCEKAFRASV